MEHNHNRLNLHMAKLLSDWEIRGHRLKLFEDDNSAWVSLNGERVEGCDLPDNPILNYALEEGLLEQLSMAKGRDL